jgi:hypothetical protein
VQVFNDTYGSNTVNYTVDDAPGFWKLNPNYPQVIENTNYVGLLVNGPIQLKNSVNIATNNTISGDIIFFNSGQKIQWSDGPSITATPTTTTTTGAVAITGNLTVTGDVTANNFPSTSDYRIKDIIEPLDSDLYSVDNLKPIKYFNKKSKKEEIGFIAHEVQESFPCLVTGEKDGEDMQTLNYIGLIGILTKEIQRLKADITELKRNQK